MAFASQGGAGGARRPFFRRRKTCPFSGSGAPKIDYKDARLLQRYVSERGKIVPSRITAVSAKKQREITDPPGGQGDGDDEGESKITVEHEGETGAGEQRGDQPRQVIPSDSRDQDRQWRQIEQHKREQRAGRQRCEEQRCRGTCANTNEDDLHHSSCPAPLWGG